MIISKQLSHKLTLFSFLAIVLVLIIHSYNIATIPTKTTTQFYTINLFIQNFFSNALSRVSVPIFFIISGFLLFQNYTFSNYKLKLLKRVHSLLIPYIFWTSLVVAIYFLLQSIPSISVYFTSSLIKNLSITELITTTWIHPKNYPLWFIRDLMLLVIVSPIVYILIQHLSKLYIPIILFVWFFDLIEPTTDFSLYKPEAVLFFSLGAYIALKNSKLLSLSVSNALFITSVILYFCVLIAYTYILTFQPTISEYVPLILYKSSLLLGIIVLWFMLDRCQCKLLSRFTQYTFLYYVFHSIFFAILQKSSYSLFGYSSQTSFVLYISIPIIVLVALTIIGKLLYSYIPNFTHIIMGNR